VSTRVVLHAIARRDLVEIADYIANDNHAAADAFLEAAVRTFDTLSRWPHSGRGYSNRAGRFKRLRFVSVRGFGNYNVYYRPMPGRVEIVRVIHAARDARRLL
jgi:toxin ParE1/3/4